MLAQNFKTAEELGIPEVIHGGLIKVLGMMERGELRHAPLHGREYHYPVGREFTGLFNMNEWHGAYDCGTVCCIGGTVDLLCGIDIHELLYEDGEKGESRGSRRLRGLFYPPETKLNYDAITVEQAARATRNYLTTGKADW